jgi:cytidyltransferase-like protein
VYAYVCGDILHRGHLLALKNAASLGDFLIVGVLTDEAIMEKKDKPVISFDERLELVNELRVVDIAVPQHEYAPHTNIMNIRPDILMESTSHSKELIEKSRKCMDKIEGKVVVFSYYPYQSSTEIKNKIKEEGEKNK